MDAQTKQKPKIKLNLWALTESAILVALAVVLSFIKIKIWANGGSIDLVMIPLFILAYRRGVDWAVPAGLVFGLIKCIIGGGLTYGALSLLFDYVLAYGAVGLAGYFRKLKGGLVIGAVVGSLARFAMHFISGVTIWKLAAATELFGNTYNADDAVLYSVIYNGSYMLVNMLLAVIVLMLIKVPLDKVPVKNETKGNLGAGMIIGGITLLILGTAVIIYGVASAEDSNEYIQSGAIVDIIGAVVAVAGIAALQIKKRRAQKALPENKV